MEILMVCRIINLIHSLQVREDLVGEDLAGREDLTGEDLAGIVRSRYCLAAQYPVFLPSHVFSLPVLAAVSPGNDSGFPALAR